MIRKESWHREALLFEGEVRSLLEQAKRGLITPEEFTLKMLRFYQGDQEEGGTYWLQEETRFGETGLHMTQGWLVAHSDIVMKILPLVEQLGPLRSDIIRTFQVAGLETSSDEKLHGYTYDEAIEVRYQLQGIDKYLFKPGYDAKVHYPPYFQEKVPQNEKEFTDWARTLPQQLERFLSLWK
jgi:hypothetical protein